MASKPFIETGPSAAPTVTISSSGSGSEAVTSSPAGPRARPVVRFTSVATLLVGSSVDTLRERVL
jgi:hypothetical protein